MRNTSLIKETKKILPGPEELKIPVGKDVQMINLHKTNKNCV